MLSPSVFCGIAGVVGSAAKAFGSNDQFSISKKSLFDILIGGAAGALIPTIMPGVLALSADPVVQFIMVAATSYATSDFSLNMFGKAGVKIQGDTTPDVVKK